MLRLPIFPWTRLTRLLPFWRLERRAASWLCSAESDEELEVPKEPLLRDEEPEPRLELPEPL